MKDALPTRPKRISLASTPDECYIYTPCRTGALQARTEDRGNAP